MDHLTEDHHRLLALFDQARCLADKGLLAQAGDVFRTLAQGAQRHMQLEEGWLFSRFEERTASSTGPTALLRDQHRQLERILEDAAAALARGSADDFRAICRRLTLIVEDHAFHEEELLYPFIEELLSPRERDLCIRDVHDEAPCPPKPARPLGALVGR